MSPRSSYAPNSIGSIMSVDIPVHLPSVLSGTIIGELAKDVEWDDIHHIYIVDEHQKFLGYVPLSIAIKAPRKTLLRHIMQKAPAVLHVDADQEQAVFEAALEKTLALAYFIPVIAYIADSVGTQSEAITVRALATLKLNYTTYILREVAIGFMLGALLGTMGALGSWLIGGDAGVAAVVGLSLLTASTLATSLAAGIPILFKKFGKDPALGSGPIATALQDILSIVVYFVFALVILGT